LGPGRACAHLLSKELAYRDRQRELKGEKGAGESGYEVWSLATVEDVERLAEALTDVSRREGGIFPPQSMVDADRLTAD